MFTSNWAPEEDPRGSRGRLVWDADENKKAEQRSENEGGRAQQLGGARLTKSKISIGAVEGSLCATNPAAALRDTPQKRELKKARRSARAFGILCVKTTRLAEGGGAPGCLASR